MFLAVLRDAARDPTIRVTAAWDTDGPVAAHEFPEEVAAFRIEPERHDESLAALAAEHDLILLIAPETGDELARLASLVRAAGGVVMLPSAGFIALASDKHASALALAAAGLPVPAGRLLAPGESLPTGFRLPAARKANGGAGCDGLLRVDSVAEGSRPATTWERAEPWEPGTPVGVAVLCGPGVAIPLPPCRQLFAGTRRPVYTGGSLLADGAAADRARGLACRAVIALERQSGAACGWVGVDMILGMRVDGTQDRLLEVNPRLTTSFIGLSAGLGGGLVRAILEAAAGRGPGRRRSCVPFSFLATGQVRLDAG
jgi:predicted ATP-grasp superfamily ATP-dependent carboligase